MLANFALHASQLFPGATSLLKFIMASLRAEDVSSMTVVQLRTQLASRITNLWQLCTSWARRSCPACSMVHPNGAPGRFPFRPSHGHPLSTSQLPSTAQFEGRQICTNFNSHRCWGSCNRAHVCLQCRGKHLVIKCQTTLLGNSKPAASNSGNNQATPHS